MTINNNQLNKTTDSKKTTFLSNHTFNLLKDAQKQLQELTGFSPSLKILINDAVNSDSINSSIQRLELKLTSINNLGVCRT